MKYALESKNEFERLEKQSRHPHYDFKKELSGLPLQKYKSVLDAGCGSGIVARYIAQENPKAAVFGCDLSTERIQAAQVHARKIKNLKFSCQGLSQLSYEDQQFDLVLSRYVFQHLPVAIRLQAVQEIFRVLKPGGAIHLVDTDGLILNLFPLTPLLEKYLPILAAHSPVDLFVGRKLPSLLANLGFTDVSWGIETTECKGHRKQDIVEIQMMQERLSSAKPALVQILGEESLATQFISDFVSCMQKKGSVYFQNKFIVTAKKPKNLKVIRGGQSE